MDMQRKSHKRLKYGSIRSIVHTSKHQRIHRPDAFARRDTPEQHAAKALMARYTPNFDKEEWKYEALAVIGAEFHWEK